MATVSVLMGSYNHEKYIGESIESVLKQTFIDFELIIVDDGSQDASQTIIKNYQKKDKRVRAFFHEKNVGIPKTTNECISYASGKFIAFIGSDDLWDISKLEKQLEILKNNEDKLVWSEGEIIDSNGNKTGQKITQLLNAPQNKKSGYLFEELLRESFIFGQGLIFKREYLDGIFFDEHLKYVSDHKFFVDLSKNHTFLFIPEPLAKYRMHEKNVTFKDGPGWLKDRILVRKYFLQKYGNEMSAMAKADLYCRIGHAFSILGKTMIAKQFYLRALSTDYLSMERLRYLAFLLTDGKGFVGKLFLASYAAFSYRLSKLLKV